MKYFIQKDKNNVITDIISYQKEGFFEIELDFIPDYFISGAFSYVNGEIYINQTVLDKIKADEGANLFNNTITDENNQIQS